MRRREFIALVSGAAVARPLATRAQPTTIPMIGFLNSASAAQSGHLAAAFRSGLSQAGFIEGQNLMIEYRWADGRYDALPKLAAELVNRPITALAVMGGPPAVLAAKAATTTLPVVFITSEPIRIGLVPSLSRPGGNLTGIAMLTSEIEPKRLEVLQELVPAGMRLAALLNPENGLAPYQTSDLQEASRHIGRPVEILNASTEPELEATFARLGQTRSSALLVAADPFFNSRRQMIVALAARHSIPTIYEWREFVEAGGLMSFGTSITDVYRQAGGYMGRVLKGEKPADMPVLQPTKFELVINLKTAKVLGLEIPPAILARANDTIE